MSKAFESSLAHHPLKVSHLEFRKQWAPVWKQAVQAGDSLFDPNLNQHLSAPVVAYILTANSVVGRDVLGTVVHNQLLNLMNDATAKFNNKAVSEDVLAGKVWTILNTAVMEGRYT